MHACSRSSRGHRGVVDVRGRSDFSRFDPRPERPHFSNFGPPTERRPGGGGGLRCAEPTHFSRVDDCKRLQATDFSRFGAHLYLVHVSRFDPKVPHFSRSSPRWPRSGRGGEKMGSEKAPCFHALNTGRCSRLHLRCGVSPSRHTQFTHKRETNIRQEIAGF
jgi:hypothetical protein